MTDFVVFCDSREKKPYSFNRYSVDTQNIELLTGDYALKDDGKPTANGFDPNFTIERKNPDDFLESITWSRERFENELQRADSFTTRMPVIVERPWSYFLNERYHRDVHLNSIKGTVSSHSGQYNVEYFFTRDRTKAEELTHEFLEWRAKQIGRC